MMDDVLLQGALRAQPSKHAASSAALHAASAASATGVSPFLVCALTAARASSSDCTHGSCAAAAAACNGVHPVCSHPDLLPCTPSAGE